MMGHTFGHVYPRCLTPNRWSPLMSLSSSDPVGVWFVVRTLWVVMIVFKRKAI